MLSGQVLVAEPRDLAYSVSELDLRVLLPGDVPPLSGLTPRPPPGPAPLEARLLLESGDSQHRVDLVAIRGCDFLLHVLLQLAQVLVDPDGIIDLFELLLLFQLLLVLLLALDELLELLLQVEGVLRIHGAEGLLGMEPLQGRCGLQAWLLLNSCRSIRESLLGVATVFLVFVFKLLDDWGA